MLRRFRIKSRLLISFFVLVFFTLIVGLTGYSNLSALRTTAVRAIHNVLILNDIFDSNSAVDTGLFNILYVSNASLVDYVIQTTREDMDKFLQQVNEYIYFKDQFRDVFSPGEMQSIENLLEIYKETYVPVVNQILELTLQGQRDEALSVYLNRYIPIFDFFVYYINVGFIKNLDRSAEETARNSQTAVFSSYLMMGLVLLSLIVSVILALAVTNSIIVPFWGLRVAMEKIAFGNLDIHIEQPQSDDEIARLSKGLSEIIRRMKQHQKIKLEAIEARHEKEKAEASSKSKGEFLAKMSHEIRTPMNAITGMAEIALREDMPDAAREHILTIKQAGVNLLAIINDILDFSKIESGKLEIVPADYFFSSLINDVISIVRMKFIDSPVRFITNIDSNIPNALFGDETRIRQVFLNVLGNAVKFTQNGFVSLYVSAQIMDAENVNMIIRIADSGKGIKPEDMNKLFGEFVQFDLFNNKDIEGTGLGLAITQSLVNAMGGRISASSEYGKGSVFTITLPQKIHEKGKLAEVENPKEKNVLVYEDRKLFADSLLFTIVNLGVECTIVSAENEFRSKISTGNYSFVFISAGLYEEARVFCSKYEADIKIVLLAEFGETAANQNLNIITMPVHCISAANTLNGITTASAFSVNKKASVKFTAPGANILVVDDIATNLKVAAGLMRPYKMRVDLALSGKEAIEAVKRNHYDIVFMDHMMPEMNGVEAAAAVRAWEKEQSGEAVQSCAAKAARDASPREQIPIIALTANVISGMREMFLDNGFNDFLPKPLDVFKLDDILGRWIPRNKQEEKTEEEKSPLILESIAGNADDDPDKLHPGEDILSEKIPGSLLLDAEIDGIDIQKGLERYDYDEEFYLELLRSYAAGVRFMLDEIEAIGENPGGFADDLENYKIKVHGIKGTSLDISAEQTAKDAAALETAAKAGDLNYINNNNSAFLEAARKLVSEIKGIIQKLDEANPKPKKDKPDDEALSKLLSACRGYDLAEAEDAMAEIEKYKYESDDGLADWLRETLDRTAFSQIVKRLS